MGYRYVEGLGEKHRDRLDDEIKRGPYGSLEDFCHRTRLPRNVLEALAMAGAFRGLGLKRRAALWQVQACAPAAHGGELPGLAAELEESVALPPADPLVQARMDFAATGLSTRWRGLGVPAVHAGQRPACCGPRICRPWPPAGRALGPVGYQSQRPFASRLSESVNDPSSGRRMAVDGTRLTRSSRGGTASVPIVPETVMTAEAAASSSRAWGIAACRIPYANRPARESWSPWPGSSSTANTRQPRTNTPS